MRWVRRFPKEEQTLWVRVIQAKYEKEDFWKTEEVFFAYGINLWRSIRNLGYVFFKRTSFNVKSGRKIKFWDDDWLGNGSLKQLFPDMYLLNQQQESTLQEVWTPQGWNLTYRRLMQDWEVEDWLKFMAP